MEKNLTQREIENIIRGKCIAWKCSYRQVYEWTYEVVMQIRLGAEEVIKMGRFDTRGSRDIVEFNVDATINRVMTEFTNDLSKLK